MDSPECSPFLLVQPNNLFSVRSSLPYFFVGFFGQGHDEHLSNHTFIYRGVEYERLEDFADQLASRFPRAKRLPYTHPPDDDVKQSTDQYLQIFLVQPVPNIPEQLKPPKERDLLTYFFFVGIIQN